jgi:putative phosphoribosyl transferase
VFGNEQKEWIITVIYGRNACFKDRSDAGKKLAEKLVRYRSEEAIVLAVPCGGVPVALEVALRLKAPLDVVVSRKIPIPYEPEAGYGAVAEDGSIFLNESLVDRLGLGTIQIEYQVEEVLAEIKRRGMLFREKLPGASLVDKTVILIDDGLASGYTMFAAVKSARRRKASKIVVASPVASGNAYELIRPVCEELVCLVVSHSYPFAVASFYHEWHDLSDEEVIASLRAWYSEQDKRKQGAKPVMGDDKQEV